MFELEQLALLCGCSTLSINTDSENHKYSLSYHSKGKHMKNIFNFIVDFFTAVSEASYAAHLARNGQWKKAQHVALNHKEL